MGPMRRLNALPLAPLKYLKCRMMKAAERHTYIGAKVR